MNPIKQRLDEIGEIKSKLKREFGIDTASLSVMALNYEKQGILFTLEEIARINRDLSLDTKGFNDKIAELLEECLNGN